MFDSPRRGKRGPASSWKLGSTRAIRVPIVLSDALLNLARQIDSGEMTLDDVFLIKSEEQDSRVLVAQSNDQKHTLEELTHKKQALATVRAEVHARYVKAHARYVKALADFAKVQKTMFFDNVKRGK